MSDDEWTRAQVRWLMRYQIVPCGIGFAVFVAILLTGDTDSLTWSRFLTACGMLIGIPLAIDLPQLWWQSERRQRRR